MKINSIRNNINFKSATINLNVFSDTHGNLELADRGYQTLVKNEKDVFEKEEKGKKNFLIIGGDWFISGGKTGYLTNPNKPLMEFQGEMLNKFIAKIKEKYPLTQCIFVPGNHETDGGVEIFNSAMRNINADVIISRAGASSVYEIAAAGIPAILVPLPTAADNHQYYNAKEFATEGAGVVLPQSELTPTKLAEILNELMQNQNKRLEMSEKAKKIAIVDAAKRLADGIENLIQREKK